MSRTLVDLVHTSQTREKEIREEFKKLKAFHKENPWVLKTKMLEQFGEISEEQFNKAIEFDESLFLDSLQKVYEQLVNTNPQLIDSKPSTIFFYSISENLFENQIKQGYHVGEIDKQGFFVSGSNIILESVPVDLKSFLNLYFSTYN